jgi:hypothetical protein
MLSRNTFHCTRKECNETYPIALLGNGIFYSISRDEQVEETPRIEINYQVNEKCFANVGY